MEPDDYLMDEDSSKFKNAFERHLVEYGLSEESLEEDEIRERKDQLRIELGMPPAHELIPSGHQLELPKKFFNSKPNGKAYRRQTADRPCRRRISKSVSLRWSGKGSASNEKRDCRPCMPHSVSFYGKAEDGKRIHFPHSADASEALKKA